MPMNTKSKKNITIERKPFKTLPKVDNMNVLNDDSGKTLYIAFSPINIITENNATTINVIRPSINSAVLKFSKQSYSNFLLTYFSTNKTLLLTNQIAFSVIQ